MNKFFYFQTIENSITVIFCNQLQQRHYDELVQIMVPIFRIYSPNQTIFIKLYHNKLIFLILNLKKFY